MKEHSVIVATARSPIGRAYKGSLKDVRPDDLAATIVRALLEKVPALKPDDIEDLILGCAQPAGEQGYNLARMVAILAGLPQTGGVTVNRYCSSSLQAIRMADHAIRAGEGDIFIAAGVECISRYVNGKADGMENTKNPRFAERSSIFGAEGAPAWSPAEGLPDAYMGMGLTAENVASLESVTREEQDAFAARSQQRAVAAQKSGFFDDEITPITLPNGEVFAKDEGPRDGTTAEKLAGLKPVFRADGTVTAGNACPLNDGAAAVLVMSESRANALGLKPLARIISSAVSALDPEIMGLGPVASSQLALKRAGLTIDDIDLVEMNEAFAAQAVPSARLLGIPEDKLNVHGGAIALGHPFGMTGARIMTTLIHGLQVRGGRYGLETMCIGGGQGMAMVIERL